MTDKEIAIKALEKAKMYDNYTAKELSFAFDVNMGGESKDNYTRQIFLSHKFAKAFWGENDIDSGEYYRTYEEVEGVGEPQYSLNEKPAWQYHLQQMVLKENILDYIKRILK